MSQLSKYAPEDFWSGSTWVSSLQNHLVNEGLHAREFLMPRYADRTKVKVLPCYLFQAGPFEEFRNGSFAEDGYLALVDIDRNTLGLVRIDDADDSPAEPKPKGPRQPTGSPYGTSTSPFDLAARFFPDFAQTTGRYRLQAILPLQSTAPVAFDLGGSPSTFSQDLASSLEAILDRRSIPAELMQETLPWRALAAPPSLGEGLRATLLTESGIHFLEVDFALPELRGERLHLEAGAVLPSGNRPPDAVKWIHVVVTGEDYLQPAKVLLPVVGGAPDQLLRGHAKIDLDRLFSGMANSDFQSVYVFSGSESIGPLELPVRKP